jgi:hypothetical protein
MIFGRMKKSMFKHRLWAGNSRLYSDDVMGSVTECPFFRLTASAIGATAIFGDFHFHGFVITAFVRTITVGLGARMTAGAIPFGSGCLFNDNWFFGEFHNRSFPMVQSLYQASLGN